MYGQLGDDDAAGRPCGLSSIVTRARIRTDPRPVSYASLDPVASHDEARRWESQVP